jgi:RNA polymerase sigma-70 factor, ECF subfamily
MELPSDAEIVSLVRGAQAHDPQAFDRIYEYFADPLYRGGFVGSSCFSFLYRSGDQHIAEELVSEVFLRMVEAIKSFRLPDRSEARVFSGWVFRIAYTRLVDHYRQQKRQTVELDESIPAAQTADDIVSRSLEHEELRAAILRLTPEQQQVVVLRFIERLSTEEVATITGQTIGAVKAMQHRALNAMAKILGASRNPREA